MPHRPALAAFILACILAGFAIAADPAAAAPGSAACKRDLAIAHAKMKQSLALVTGANSLPPKERCANYFRAQEMVTEIRSGFERCEADDKHADAIRNVDEVDTELTKTVNRHCPPSPGMIRINAIFVKRIGASELPQGVAALHSCETLPRVKFIDEPFENGRIMLAGCKGTENASAQESAARNASAAALADEQTAVYLALDSDGRGARRLTLPILLPDGREGMTDLIPAQSASPPSRDRLAGNWAPAQDGVCRIHAEWKFPGGQPSLVLWQELADCTKSGPPAFKTIIDRR
jgi:hypothetical protein